MRSVVDLVEESRRDVDEIDCSQALCFLNAGDVKFVDVREDKEYLRDGRIPGSVWIPRGMLEFWIDPDSKYYKGSVVYSDNIVVYCAGGMRSVLACKVMQEMGYGRVKSLKGGFREWKDRGYPVEYSGRK